MGRKGVRATLDIVAILTQGGPIAVGILNLINHYKANNNVTTQVTIDKFFAGLSDDQKSYLAAKAQIAEEVANNIDPG